ncbi:MAG: DUF4190 domain-containing protein [Candidatus Saccharibacteria bacterium]
MDNNNDIDADISSSNSKPKNESVSSQIAAPAKYSNNLSVIGLVLAFLFGPAGVVVCLVALFKSKKANQKDNMALAGLILSVVGIIIWILVYAVWLPAGMFVIRDAILSDHSNKCGNSNILSSGDDVSKCGTFSLLKPGYIDASGKVVDVDINPDDQVGKSRAYQLNQNPNDKYDVYFKTKDNSDDYYAIGNFMVVDRISNFATIFPDDYKFDKPPFNFSGIRMINGDYILIGRGTDIVNSMTLLNLNNKKAYQFSAYVDGFSYWNNYYFFTDNDSTYKRQGYHTGISSSVSYIDARTGEITKLFPSDAFKDYSVIDIVGTVLNYKQRDYKSAEGIRLGDSEVTQKVFSLSDL